MADEDKSKGLLWMFRQHATAGRPNEVQFEPSDAIYQLHRNSRNPFLQRAIAPSPAKLQRSEQDLARLFRFFERWQRYRVGPENQAEPFERRQLEHPAPPPTTRPAYVGAERLPGNLRRLPWMVDVFFKAVLSRLRRDPGEFADVVEELLDEFRRDDVRIKIYEAYRNLQDWDDLMDTLEEIGRYPAPETFDLFCSALFAYYDLVYPPEG